MIRGMSPHIEGSRPSDLSSQSETRRPGWHEAGKSVLLLNPISSSCKLGRMCDDRYCPGEAKGPRIFSSGLLPRGRHLPAGALRGGLPGGIPIGSTSSESVSFALYTTTTAGGSTHWSGPGNSGMLISAGSPNFPALTTINGNPQTSPVERRHDQRRPIPKRAALCPRAFGSGHRGGRRVGKPSQRRDRREQSIGVAFNSGTLLNSSATIAGNRRGQLTRRSTLIS